MTCLVFLSFSLMACSASEQNQAQVSPLPPEARRSDVVSAEGVVVPHKSANLAFRVSGRVAEILVQQGQTVTAGTELVRLDLADLQQNVLRATAALESARAELVKAETGARTEEIASAKASVAAAQANVTSSELAVVIAGANVSSAEGALAEARAGALAAEEAIAIAQGDLSAARATYGATEARLQQVRAGASEEDLAIARQRIDQAKSELWAAQNQRDAIGGFDTESAEYEGARARVAVAETAITIAELQYQGLVKGATAQEIAIAEAEVAQARANIDTRSALLAQATSELERANARVTQAEASVEIAKAQLEQRAADVSGAEAAVRQSQSQLDLLSAGTRSEDLAVARAQVASAEAGLAEAQNALNDAVLRAPYDGTVGELLVEEGELVVAQTTALRFGDLTRLQVRTTDLSEVDVDAIAVGQEAIVSIDALDGDEFGGNVSAIGTIAGDQRGDTVYEVTIELPAAQSAPLRWGMSAFVEIKLR